MSFEGMPKEVHVAEKGPERMPTKDEVRHILGEIIGGSFSELRAKEDEQGLVFFEAQAGNSLYTYNRDGKTHEGKWHPTIYETIMDGDMPTGGDNVARFEDGAWKKVSNQLSEAVLRALETSPRRG